jgi:hypothetical protein
MSVPDAGGSRSRLAAAEALLAENRRLRQRLAARYGLREYTFASDVLPLGSGALSARGDWTDLASALKTAARELRRGGAAGILLVSDGIHNAETDLSAAVSVLRRRRMPVFAVALGQAEPDHHGPDVSVRSLVSTERTFVGGRVLVTATVHSRGPGPAWTAVVLRRGAREVARRLLEFEDGPADQAVRFEAAARERGVHKLTLEASPVPGEADLEDNSQSTLVRVTSEALTVFYLEGRIRPEFQFARRGLGAAPQVRLVAANAFLAPEGVAGVLDREERWSGLHVFILGDVSAEQLGAAGLARLARFVSSGGGLLVLGGARSFGAGGYAGTPLARVLPVRLGPEEGRREGEFHAVPTEAGHRHFITRFAHSPQQNAAMWAALPPLHGGNGVAGPKEDVVTLLEGPEEWPVLVVWEPGLGRAAALTVESTWRWAFSPRPAREQHRLFWQRLVLWLGRADIGEPPAIAVSTDRARYAAGARPEVTAVVRPAQGRFAAAEIVAVHRTPAGRRVSVPLGRGPGTHRGALHEVGAEPGEHRLIVEARGDDGRPLAAAETAFLVLTEDVEAERRRANLELLRRLAHQTGGGVFTAAGAAEAFERLLHREPAREPPRPEAVAEAAGAGIAAGLLVLFVGAMTGEWLLRHRRGLP